MTQLPLIARAATYGNSPAFDGVPDGCTYSELLWQSERLAQLLCGHSGDLGEARVAMLLPTGRDYAAAQWAVWRAGGIVLPLCSSAAEPEWEYALTDSGTSTILTCVRLQPVIEPVARRLGIPLLFVEGAAAGVSRPLPFIDAGRRAMMLYTSGTTGKPRGVITTHAMIQAQIEALVQAWEWSSADRIPLFLPLHHIHGIINVLSCALWSGAAIEPFQRFDPTAVLGRIRQRAYSLFMAVPTIYVRLIELLESASESERRENVSGFQAMRLMVSGSAALPASVHNRWFELTGHKLLERYGMTEIGMALSNPLHGERRPGFVGQPLPGVEIRLSNEAGEVITDSDQPGEIQVRGPGVFNEYWKRPEATLDSFIEGWFRTGDIAIKENGSYRILGRSSVDIIKSGGYKLSALEIETVLLDHPAIRECAVVGLPDAEWGEQTAVAVVLQSGSQLDLDSLRDWCRERMSVYKLPRKLVVVGALPRNAMGKVTKPEVRRLFDS
jgi:malonyl-CoA/methylmalonyl-CoA synthetase